VDEYTPGPWGWAQNGTSAGAKGCVSEIVSRETGGLVVSLVNHRGETYSDGKHYAGNARLIAAAPTLRAVCERLRAFLDGVEPAPGVCAAYVTALKEAADAVLAEVKGASS
jgi:hypothetical protein